MRGPGQSAPGSPRPPYRRLISDPALLDAVVDAVGELGMVLQWTIRPHAVHLIRFAAARRPTVIQILDHLGLSDHPTDLHELDRVRRLAEVPNRHVKLSGMYACSRTAYPYPDTWGWAEGVLDAFGSERVMWVSDWPLCSDSAAYPAQRAPIERLPFVDGGTRRDVLSTTAMRVWGIAGRESVRARSEPDLEPGGPVDPGST